MKMPTITVKLSTSPLLGSTAACVCGQTVRAGSREVQRWAAYHSEHCAKLHEARTLAGDPR